MNVLFRQQQLLYESGARNFMFIDVPPIQHSPAGKQLVIKLVFLLI